MPAPPTPSAGDRILQGMLGRAPEPADAPPPPAASSVETAVARIERLADTLVRRILVSARGEIGNAEVRIQLRDSVLPDTDIRLRREDGQLVVSFESANPAVVEQLAPQIETLRQQLATRLEVQVRVEILERPASGMAGDGQPGDGRSRNRQDPREYPRERFDDDAL